MFPNSSLIITSIASPNTVMKEYAEKCKEKNIEFIVIGDSKSPKDFQLDGCRFYSLEEQRQLSFKLSRLLPEKHYARKNLGYLLSKEKDFIIETDDDNFPKENFWKKTFDVSQARVVEQKGWANVFKLFSAENIWPRGFPMENIQQPNAKTETQRSKFEIKVLQGLADENPDVDAVYRMTMKLPFNFEKNSPVILNEGAWCPFNTQNTVWKKEAFPLMYLPSYCSFRMTDIWRSFIVQRIAWTCGWKILFHEADVIQDRNEHNLLKDFEDEIPGYLNNSRICKMLQELNLENGEKNISENLLRCYTLMTDQNFIGKEELPLLDAWLSEFA